ncbi:alkyl hydroperoxide reductase/ Thiol specific antioxidant/ Mal allergen [Methylocella silvestris BL2]|uniref:Alkyl hydroperoxide reductase/ Thiol specific antioxidant/ Mal allergen n=1 Tax=Methylocella silvestris (strain DSM 15510 / CIP 108128 / LMG 27833 / NCIMB 13906 / BL2) TaxID=395965 RepID=B8ESD9_METSB|nr:peroxiredoxin-like family protein [Methylocella silvestris]ACK49829.1 alkyl hydroperoxide reductase/ Thiol specific antioxidant/ Mal allergen [Methylocella silvestris BL2]
MNTRTKLREALANICAAEMTLGQRLAAYAAAMREFKSPFSDEYDRIVERLRTGEAGAGAPQLGELMPSFVLPAADGRLVSLDQLLARGPLVVSFNRGHWCPFCKIELRSLAAAEGDIVGCGAQIVSIMPDRQPFVAPLAAELAGKVLILTDMDNSYALSLGLAMWIGAPVQKLCLDYGLPLQDFQGNNAWFLPLPATFVVAPDGRVAARFVNPEFRARMAIEDIMAALQSQRA